MTILLLFAALAGALTILAPCTLPIVPLMLGASGGGGRARPLGVVVGLAISFTAFTVALAAALDALGLTTTALRRLAIVALAGFGLALLVPAIGARLEAPLAPLGRLGGRASGAGRPRAGFGGGLLLGAALGLVWAPCTGPIMATVIALAATRGATSETVAVALAFALGAAGPLLAVGYGGRAVARRAGGLTGHGRAQRAFGALMLLTCAAMLFNLDLRAQDALASALPADWTNRLYGVERQAPAQRALEALRAPATPAAPALSAMDRTAAPARPAVALPAASPTGAPPATAAAPPRPTAPPPAAFGAAAPAAGPTVKLQNLGAAPEVTGITAWINAAPLSLRDLRGKVVLVHFWTFGCINCIHVQPYVKDWYARYKDQGFTVLSIHTPELSFEKDLNNVRAAVKDQGVRYPVAFDPRYATWTAYNNAYWPAFYYVDKQGQIRYTHIGEGDYEGQEQVIRQLLQEPGP
jgi:cytochrome c biogenesis protein CcdA/thiol-disulfide isomerase/thioredoxin